MRIFVQIVAAGIAAMSLAGCVTSLSEQARMVREVKPADAKQCEFLGVVTGSEGTGWDASHNRQGALNEVRNKVANLGGNAFVLNDISSSQVQSMAQAEAYNCSD